MCPEIELEKRDNTIRKNLQYRRGEFEFQWKVFWCWQLFQFVLSFHVSCCQILLYWVHYLFCIWNLSLRSQRFFKSFRACCMSAFWWDGGEKLFDIFVFVRPQSGRWLKEQLSTEVGRDRDRESGNYWDEKRQAERQVHARHWRGTFYFEVPQTVCARRKLMVIECLSSTEKCTNSVVHD